MNQPASNYVPSGADLFSNILNKAKLILFKPKEAWATFKNEQETVADFYKSYLIYMTAIAPICSLLGGMISGWTASFTSSIVMAVLTYALALVMPFIMGFVATKIASMCSGELSMDNAVRLIGYASTATYVAGFLSLIPLLALLSILFMIYSIYTMYVGVPIMSSVPENQAVKFTVLTILAWILVSIVIWVGLIPVFIGTSIATTAVQ